MTHRERIPGYADVAPHAGRLRIHAGYRPATSDGGGDIYDVIETAFGVRVLVGDVMGTGVPASETAAGILTAWRTIAPLEPTLAGAAVRLHGLITASAHPERFVTAFLLNIDGRAWTEVVCCGHPPPLLLSGESASYLDACPIAPPLGLLDMADGWCTPGTFRFTGDDRLLLYTDGVSEARDVAGDFFPLAERAQAAARAHPHHDDGLLGALMSDLDEYTSRTTRDDILMLTVSRDRLA
jgi:serine phosphatase RsbU (regulator of sigma subunit)